ncbi:hypothetical protein [Paenibacillus larvae]|uniref:hypothetical protein n=1 Tax=Paenibacillus larvae TaxID=1464 RepID=UPI002890B10F|nr:hypothetical protein [Paenibacillus larvae]MDT2193061.1 hypothetical protein [Paenibacillus larvae]MDT2240363.1 hypothetical protein [Paenibacillus larvae]MDT2246985.1 hypothetical protein [Paenibacillus larvae]MDT2258621.1 hypothetical protein [Paenibacillus larvae]MDT2262710.1 hypothetical protein [Paenibacillus larvae]
MNIKPFSPCFFRPAIHRRWLRKRSKSRAKGRNCRYLDKKIVAVTDDGDKTSRSFPINR